MARPKKHPEYNPERIQQELMLAVIESYKETGELKKTAEEFNISPLKIRKLLITTGAYKNEISDTVQNLIAAGKTLPEIQRITGLKKSSINGYLPYTKIIYNSSDLSHNAERIKVYRQRQQAVSDLHIMMSEDNLWAAFISFQNYPFHTVKGLPFTYELGIGRDGEYTKELFVNRKKESKSIVWNSICVAFKNTRELRGTEIDGLKSIGDIYGASYIYPIFSRFGLV